MSAERDKQAIGLRYGAGDEGAPRVVAKGRGEIAERLLAIAEEHGVPIRRDPDLLQFLSATQVGEEVPEEVYGAVAALIAFLWRLNGSEDHS